MGEGNSLRDEMKDVIKEFLNRQCQGFGFKVLFDELVPELCDVIFDMMSVDEEVQDGSYIEYVKRRNLILEACKNAQ